MVERCQHLNVLVHYEDPLFLLTDALISELKTTDLFVDRKNMTIFNPRCEQCGRKFSLSDLMHRIEKGGDLYDPRFVWEPT